MDSQFESSDGSVEGAVPQLILLDLRSAATRHSDTLASVRRSALGGAVLLSPVGLALIACVAFGFALAAREAMGRERGLREATEQTHLATVQAVTDKNDRQEKDLDRYQRLLECYVDAIIAGMSELREGNVPSPGGILEKFCATSPAWKRELTECTGLKPLDVERLLHTDVDKGTRR